MAKLSVVIVSYNSSKNLNKLLMSLKLIDDIVEEIIIVDNKSDDFERIYINNSKTIFIKNNANNGFSKAVNQGVKIAKCNFILLLNPDTLLIDSSIKRIFKTIVYDNNIGIIGGKIQNYYSNDYQNTATSQPNLLIALFEFTNFKKLFPNNKYSRKFWIETSEKISSDKNVTSLCGAFFIFRRFANNELNLFDENFFLYLEDIDFGIKNINLGYRVVFSPHATIKHIGGASNESKYNIVLKHWYNSRRYFFKKHFGLIMGIFLAGIFTVEELFLEIYHLLKNESST